MKEEDGIWKRLTREQMGNIQNYYKDSVRYKEECDTRKLDERRWIEEGKQRAFEAIFGKDNLTREIIDPNYCVGDHVRVHNVLSAYNNMEGVITDVVSCDTYAVKIQNEILLFKEGNIVPLYDGFSQKYPLYSRVVVHSTSDSVWNNREGYIAEFYSERNRYKLRAALDPEEGILEGIFSEDELEPIGEEAPRRQEKDGKESDDTTEMFLHTMRLAEKVLSKIDFMKISPEDAARISVKTALGIAKGIREGLK